MSFFGVELNAQINRLMHAVKLTLAKNKYLPNFRTIYQSFIKYDPEQTGIVTANQFEKAINQNGIFFKKFQIQVFEKAFDAGGKINWFGFMSLLRTPLSAYKSQVIDSVFQFLDVQKAGKVHYTYLMQKFNPSQINQFKLGYKSKDTICKQLLGLVPLTPDGYITAEEFNNFYSDLSINIASDEIFGRYVCSHWNCPFVVPQKVAIEEVKAAIRIIRFKMIQCTGGTHEEFILLKLFNEFDPNKRGFLGQEELTAMLVKLQIPTELINIKPLFQKMDHNKSGTIQFDEFKNFLFFDPYPL